MLLSAFLFGDEGLSEPTQRLPNQDRLSETEEYTQDLSNEDLSCDVCGVQSMNFSTLFLVLASFTNTLVTRSGFLTRKRVK